MRIQKNNSHAIQPDPVASKVLTDSCCCSCMQLQQVYI